MTRVKQVLDFINVIVVKLGFSFTDLRRVQRVPRALKRSVKVGNAVVGIFLVMCLLGASDNARATDGTSIEVKPIVTQPDGILTLTFSNEVTPTSVKIGNTDASFVSQSASTKTIEVKLSPNTPLGRQGITVNLGNAATSPLTSSVIVAPLVSGLKANKNAQVQWSRVVVAGGEVILQFSDSIPTEIRQKLVVKLGQRQLSYTIPQNDYLVLQVPSDLDSATYPVEVFVDGATQPQPFEKQPRLRVEYESTMYWRAFLFLGIVITLFYLVYRFFYKVPEGQQRYSFVKMLLLEQENQTYSLSRTQFLGWLLVIVWCFLFIFFAHGYVEQTWAYPNLGNAGYAFLISLGTLVVSQATNLGQGVKGAGEVHPSLADLVVHGGVLALDRLQQLVWTLIALGMFVWITVSTYYTATALPEIPPELLGLMGLSSVGYLGGKLVRGAGPVIEQVTVRDGSAIVNIKGRHLSKDGFVWLDGIQQPKDKVRIVADDTESPLGFAKELELTTAISMAEWNAKDHALTIINGDSQRADWRTGPEILDVKPEKKDEKTIITIKGARMAPGAKLEIPDVSETKPGQDKSDPNLFTVEVDPAWIKEPHLITVTSGGFKTSYPYKPA